MRESKGIDVEGMDMRGLIFLAGLIGGAMVGVVLGYPIGELLADYHHVSNFEGGRGMYIFLYVMPNCGTAGIIIGGIIGAMLAIRRKD